MQSFGPDIREQVRKLEHYCAYQERCHEDVRQRMQQLKIPYSERDAILVHLIEQNFLNEERFAITFAGGKHRIKYWGKVRITHELQNRNISSRIIYTALNAISDSEYEANFRQISEKIWTQETQSNLMLKKKKCADFLIRKGYETSQVFDRIRELSAL